MDAHVSTLALRDAFQNDSVAWVVAIQHVHCVSENVLWRVGFANLLILQPWLDSRGPIAFQ